MSCQPSVAVVMSGEKITPEIIKILKKYSIFEIDVL
jgi:arginine/lysine/ornithine decarboxylase